MNKWAVFSKVILALKLKSNCSVYILLSPSSFKAEDHKIIKLSMC